MEDLNNLFKVFHDSKIARHGQIRAENEQCGLTDTAKLPRPQEEGALKAMHKYLERFSGMA
jgi:hypothetical protein